ncbi:MAG: ABC transporter ATP-binding protein [Armatimonadetes bacterium]|nr:ABC transporter ATP-binding protein [Armatimonadota bacterium]
MSDIAIRVEKLGKRYRIGQRERYLTLRDTIARYFTAPFRLFRRNDQSPFPNPQSHNSYIWALKDVSFEVRQGEVVGIIGRNGAGKSTLLKILARITEPTEGYAEVRGRVGSLLEVGTGFHPELTGRENIYMSGAVLGMRKREIDKKFDEIVAFAELEKFIDTPVKYYSSGMYVRLAFAVAAHLDPEILLVDEVLAVGDAAFQKKCLGKMEDVAKEGRTVLFVSHNMAAVTQLCHYSVWLDEGHIVKKGESQEVVEAYLSTVNTQIPERKWSYPGDAPGDDRVRLLGARILQNGKISSVVDINQPLQIEIEFGVLRPVSNLITGVNLYDAQGVCLFSSCDWRPNHLLPGVYRKRVHIPGPFLAEGRFRVLVQLVFYEPDIKSAVVPNALCFEAVDSDHPLSVRGLYKGKWPGVVRPYLNWDEAEYVGSLSTIEVNGLNVMS